MTLYREPVEPRTSPSVRLKLSHRNYRSWKAFLDHAYWSVELEQPPIQSLRRPMETVHPPAASGMGG